MLLLTSYKPEEYQLKETQVEALQRHIIDTMMKTSDRDIILKTERSKKDKTYKEASLICISNSPGLKAVVRYSEKS